MEGWLGLVTLKLTEPPFLINFNATNSRPFIIIIIIILWYFNMYFLFQYYSFYLFFTMIIIIIFIVVFALLFFFSVILFHRFLDIFFFSVYILCIYFFSIYIHLVHSHWYWKLTVQVRHKNQFSLSLRMQFLIPAISFRVQFNAAFRA